MKKTELMNNMGRTFHKVGFQLQKKSPEILVGLGIVGMVTSAVMACKATLKVNEIVEKTQDDLDRIHKSEETGMTPAGESYSKDDCKKDLTLTYVQTGVAFAKLYGPAVMLGAVSVTSILASHRILKKRNVALAAAYTAIDHSFKDYRKRVLDRFGEQVEKELRYNIKAQEIEETVVDAKGKEKTVKKTADVVDEGWDPNKYSPYAKIFDELHPDWMKDAERNMFYLKARQSQANDMLKARGHLFLNEVYDLLGFERTKAGAVVGWVYDPDEPIGDNFVDFGIFEIQRPKARDFVNGYEPAIVLDFNVVGDITNLIATHQYL